MKKVNYLPVWGFLLLLLGLVNLYLGFQIDRVISMVLGGMLVLLGILHFSNPAIVYSSSKIELKNLLGMTMKTYKFDTDQITVENNRIYSKGKKIAISPIRVNKGKMDEMIAFVSSIIDNDTAVKKEEVKKDKPVSEDEELLDA